MVTAMNRTRGLVLGLTGHPWVSRTVTRYGMRLGARRFVAGERLDEAMTAIAGLNRVGIRGTLDYLGESVQDAPQAEAACETYCSLVEEIARRGLDTNVSLKASQLGLDLDPKLALELVGRVVETAGRHGNFVRIDMEDSHHTQATLDLFRALRERHENVGIVIQAYLRRSAGDMRDLAAMGASVRLCKGAYLEPPEVAFPDKKDVDASFEELMRAYMASGNHLAVATHDDRMIAAAKRFADELRVPRDRFEFQMLYGIRPRAQRELAADGYRMRVYVPYGTEWYPYFSRRLAERPANILFVLANLFRR
ncbi:proline dehydrogenase family protein [Limnochorda pilosa]|uniref:proline dehydrogenase n=1 Tax=Limnochorda pilosa TaxID=1555112 RepID=A0A0K2SNY8_LIMPI|nr:proline dehydrogenase family protein [Limnochorda pilosa]BAS28830.1 proline dehydrogenase [Limnochorda pilosa]